MATTIQQFRDFLQAHIDALAPIEARSSIARGKLQELRDALAEVRRIEAEAVKNLEPT